MTQAIKTSKALRDLRVVGGVPSARRPIGVTATEDREQAAYERGLREGESALREQLLLQRNEFLELQRGVLESLRQAVPLVVHDSENALISLALEAARKLIAGLPISVEMVEAVVREALAQVEDSAEISVALHADDFALLQNEASPLLSPAAGAPKTYFRFAPEVTRGGCLVHTRFGVIDARRETKLELLSRNLRS
jgi:flagellar assembly protein FliH